MLDNLLKLLYNLIYVQEENSNSTCKQRTQDGVRVAEYNEVHDRFFYPPPKNGIPFLGIDDILSKHKKLITRIQLVSSVRENDFKEWYIPIIESYAKYIHLLPASEDVHHSLPGGLLAHGLEVGLASLLKADRSIVGMHKVPEERIDYEKRWKLAVFVVALAHDIGKPLSDVIVLDDQNNQWSPLLNTLYDWGYKLGSNHYTVSWNKGRVMRHEGMATVAFNVLVDEKIKNYLYSGDPEILALMIDAINCSSGNMIYNIVKEADQESCELDLKTNPLKKSEMRFGIPVQVHLQDAIIKIFSSAEFGVNKQNGLAFSLPIGLFLKWPESSKLIIDILKKEDNLSGVPNSPTMLADLLIDSDLAKAGKGLFESRMRTWRLHIPSIYSDGWFLQIRDEAFKNKFDDELSVVPGNLWDTKNPEEIMSTIEENAAEDLVEKIEIITESQKEKTSLFDVTSLEKIKYKFEQYDIVGDILYTLVQDYAINKAKEGDSEDFILGLKELPVSWDFIRNQGIASKQILDSLKQQKLIKMFEPTKPLHSISGKQYIFFNESVKLFIEEVIESIKSIPTEVEKNVISHELLHIDYFKITNDAIKSKEDGLPNIIETDNGQIIDLSEWLNWLKIKTGHSIFNIRRTVMQIDLSYFVITDEKSKFLRIN